MHIFRCKQKQLQSFKIYGINCRRSCVYKSRVNSSKFEHQVNLDTCLKQFRNSGNPDEMAPHCLLS